jgi:RNA polymerase sigma-70 factor (ECF subfamily)
MTDRASSEETRHVLDLLVRRERGRLIAGLVNRFGSRNLELAEDVAQEAIVTALGVWPYEGVPRDPTAWLARVAGNGAIDRLRREKREIVYDAEVDCRASESVAEDFGAHAQPRDPELRLIFLACHPELDGVDRLALTLRIVSGFTARELAEIFLSTEPAIAQRLSRSRRKLRKLDPAAIASPSDSALDARLGAVLKVVYLMFSLGYAPRSGARLIRRDVTSEALRLARDLADRPATATPTAKALAALLCFQASRSAAREDGEGRPILFADQDRAAWDGELIDRGLRYLQEAKAGELISRYHVEAGIAACYAVAPSWSEIDWPRIVTQYRQLERLTDSPVVTINASIANAFAGDAEGSLARLEGLRRAPLVEGYAPYHVARAEILRLLGRVDESNRSYRDAIATGFSVPVVEHLKRRLATNL